jgi:hypothetical protein
VDDGVMVKNSMSMAVWAGWVNHQGAKPRNLRTLLFDDEIKDSFF